LRRFELGRREASRRTSWLTSAVLHTALAVLAVTVAWQAPLRTRRVERPEVREWVVLPSADDGRARSPAAASTSRRVRIVPAPLAAAPLEVPLRPPSRIGSPSGPFAAGPELGDGRVWVTPRPALPAELADALYGTDTIGRDARVAQRLSAMLDSVNQMIDIEQRGRRRPTWGGDVAGVPFALDSQYITIAGIKIPTTTLAMLGNLLPPGNYEGSLRARQFEDMRQDLLRAASRSTTFKDFQKYVKELRARKQAERDAARARPTPPDTTKPVIP
jgi:hypothetical protein